MSLNPVKRDPRASATFPTHPGPPESAGLAARTGGRFRLGRHAPAGRRQVHILINLHHGDGDADAVERDGSFQPPHRFDNPTVAIGPPEQGAGLVLVQFQHLLDTNRGIIITLAGHFAGGIAGRQDFNDQQRRLRRPPVRAAVDQHVRCPDGPALVDAQCPSACLRLCHRPAIHQFIAQVIPGVPEQELSMLMRFRSDLLRAMDMAASPMLYPEGIIGRIVPPHHPRRFPPPRHACAPTGLNARTRLYRPLVFKDPSP